MAKRKSTRAKVSAASLRNFALSLPEAEATPSCNKIAFKAGKKNFCFLGEGKDPEAGAFGVMLKLTDSLAEAKKLAKSDPQQYRAGSNGWVNADFAKGEAPPAGLLEGWIEESFRALVPKKIVAQLDG